MCLIKKLLVFLFLFQLLLIDVMSHKDAPESAIEAAEILQHQLYYNGETLEIALDSLKNYKEQSIS